MAAASPLFHLEPFKRHIHLMLNFFVLSDFLLALSAIRLVASLCAMVLVR